MAMARFDQDELHAPLAEINTTPLVDVMLVLLVIFLVTAPILTQAVKLELPKETAKEIKEEKKPITVSIDADSTYYWNDEPIAVEVLNERFSTIAATDPKQPIHLRADTNIAYGKVNHVLAAAEAAGLTSIGLITQPK